MKLRGSLRLLQRRSFLPKLIKVIVALALTTISLPAVAQNANQQPSAAPSKALISVSTTLPVPRNGGFGFSFLIRVQSKTGEPIPIAVPFTLQGWTAFTSNGENCMNVFPSESVTRIHIDGSVYNNADPFGFTAGASRPAFIPVQAQCKVRPGDTVSITATFLLLVNKHWQSEQFTWEQQQIQ